MAQSRIHRFEREGRRFAIDSDTCFCFECDEISWDVLEHYPHEPVNRIYKLLGDKHDVKELGEVISELEWLRATKSILKTRTPQEMQDEFKPGHGLRSMTIATRGRADHVQDAVALFLGRSESHRDLSVKIVIDASSDIDALTRTLENAQRIANLSDKRLTVIFRAEFDRIPKAPAAIEGHQIAFEAEVHAAGPQSLKAAAEWAVASGARALKASAKAASKLTDTSCRAAICPANAQFGGAIPALHEAGFTTIAIELDDAQSRPDAPAPMAMIEGLQEAANYYANALLKGDYFRLEPIADLFRRIYEGKPTQRHDPAGVHTLAVNESGAIFPSAAFIANGDFNLGTLDDGSINNDRIAPFDNIGVPTTGVCRNCWARSLCGGGTAAIHHARTGDIHRPDTEWCDAQRAWYTGAVSAFNILSSRGINFTRTYQNIAPGPRPSIFRIARAAMSMTVSVRQIEESDAPWLVQWENWTEAAYFLHGEGSLLVATEYDREMNALHPTSADQELILTRKGEDIGLLKIRPTHDPGGAWAWLYFRNPDHYQASDIQRGIKLLVGEAVKGQSIRSVIAPAMESETGLQALLESLGFQRQGTQREAIFLHSKYHDIHIYGASFA